jgi:hypothetical protein
MYDYIYLGPTPANEPCVQTTDPDYGIKAHAECERYKALLESTYSAAHDGQPCPARIMVKSEAHDFGHYYEVVCRFDANDHAQCEAAYWLDSNSPTEWPETKLCETRSARMCDDSCIGAGPMYERC